jgi:hypothetical protein
MDLLLNLLAGGAGNLAAYLAAHVLLCLVPAFFIAGEVLRPSQRVIAGFGISADIAPAMKNAGTRHSSTCAAR